MGSGGGGKPWLELVSKSLETIDLVVLARQCSKRGGELNITVRNDDRVNLAGHSVVVLRGEIDI